MSKLSESNLGLKPTFNHFDQGYSTFWANCKTVNTLPKNWWWFKVDLLPTKGRGKLLHPYEFAAFMGMWSMSWNMKQSHWANLSASLKPMFMIIPLFHNSSLACKIEQNETCHFYIYIYIRILDEVVTVVNIWSRKTMIPTPVGRSSQKNKTIINSGVMFWRIYMAM